MTPSEDCSKVHVVLDVAGLANAITGVVLRRLPSPKSIQTWHDGVALGSEAPTAVEQRKALNQEIEQIKRALQGVVEAFAISDEELGSMREKYDERLQGETAGSSEAEVQQSES